MRVDKYILAAIADRKPEEIPDDLVKATNDTLHTYEINTPMRAAHFLAQVAHESGGFRWNKEIWGPTEAQKGYEGRRDLGNIVPGDGKKYAGRGYIQLTGRDNYRQYSDYKDFDFVNNPELVAENPFAMDVAGWFWHTRDLNHLADQDDSKKITKRINGGYNGAADRERRLAIAKAAIKPAKVETKQVRVEAPEKPQMDLKTSPMPTVQFYDSKPLWASKRVWGAVVTVVGVFGADTGWMKEILAEWDSIIAAAGIIFWAYGSVVAKQRIILWPNKK